MILGLDCIVWVAGWHMNCIFCVLMVKPNALYTDENLFMLHCSPTSELTFRAQSSAKRRSHTDVIFTLVWACSLLRSNRFPSELKHSLMESSWSENVSNSTAVNNMLNCVRASTHPCLTPSVTGKASDDWLSLRTHTSILSWSEHTRVMNLGGQPNLDMIFQRPSQQTVLKAFVRSIKEE